jgi:2-polyprenyl-6-methoxyphenol hydroxylase-like FAD-dependent oxidoreductase
VLRRYERWRKRRQPADAGYDGRFQTAVRQFPATGALLRNIGLNLTDAAGPLKKRSPAEPWDLEGDLPKLARAAS